MRGRITNYFKDKKYGFITGEDGINYFFHNEHFLDETETLFLRKGQKVQFLSSFNDKGYFASKIFVNEMPQSQEQEEKNNDLEVDKEYVYKNVKSGIKVIKWFTGVYLLFVFCIVSGVIYIIYTYVYPKFTFSQGNTALKELYEGNPSTYILNDRLLAEIKTIQEFERGMIKNFNIIPVNFIDTERLRDAFYNNEKVASEFPRDKKGNFFTNECKKITDEMVDQLVNKLSPSEKFNYAHEYFASGIYTLNKRVYDTKVILNSDCKIGLISRSGFAIKSENKLKLDRVSIIQTDKALLSLHKLKNYVALKDRYLHFTNEQYFYNTKNKAFVAVNTDIGSITIYLNEYVEYFLDTLAKEITDGDVNKLIDYKYLLAQYGKELKTEEEKKIDSKVKAFFVKQEVVELGEWPK